MRKKKPNGSVDALLNVAIGWESFLSEWHMAATNRKSTAFVADLQNRVEASLVGQGWSAALRPRSRRAAPTTRRRSSPRFR
jgi:hypothetical protein